MKTFLTLFIISIIPSFSWSFSCSTAFPDYKAKIEVLSCKYIREGLVSDLNQRNAPIVGKYKLEKKDMGVEIKGMIYKTELINFRFTKAQPGAVIVSERAKKKYLTMPEKFEGSFYFKTPDKKYCDKIALEKYIEANLYFRCCAPREPIAGCAAQQPYYTEEINIP